MTSQAWRHKSLRLLATTFYNTFEVSHLNTTMYKIASVRRRHLYTKYVTFYVTYYVIFDIHLRFFISGKPLRAIIARVQFGRFLWRNEIHFSPPLSCVLLAEWRHCHDVTATRAWVWLTTNDVICTHAATTTAPYLHYLTTSSLFEHAYIYFRCDVINSSSSRAMTSCCA